MNGSRELFEPLGDVAWAIAEARENVNHEAAQRVQERNQRKLLSDKWLRGQVSLHLNIGVTNYVPDPDRYEFCADLERRSAGSRLDALDLAVPASDLLGEISPVANEHGLKRLVFVEVVLLGKDGKRKRRPRGFYEVKSLSPAHDCQICAGASWRVVWKLGPGESEPSVGVLSAIEHGGRERDALDGLSVRDGSSSPFVSPLLTQSGRPQDGRPGSVIKSASITVQDLTKQERAVSREGINAGHDYGEPLRFRVELLDGFERTTSLSLEVLNPTEFGVQRFGSFERPSELEPRIIEERVVVSDRRGVDHA